MPPATEASPLFLSSERIDALKAWCCSDADVVSLHLPVDGTGSYPALLDKLVKETLEVEPRLKLLSRDLEVITRYVRREFVPGARRGLSVFSATRYGAFGAFAAPEPFRPSLTVAERPCLRSYETLRGRYHRYLVLLASPAQSRFVEIFLGECVELGSSGPMSAESLAARAAELMRTRGADRLVLGGAPEFLVLVSAHLPLELKERVIHEPLLGPDRPLEAVVERVRHNEREALKVRESVLIHRMLDELRDGGAVGGLGAAAAALQQGCVKLLLVEEGWAKMGRMCPACGRLSVDHRSCPWCFRATETVLDLVGELIDRAVAAGIEVFPAGPDHRLVGLGHIAAELAVPAQRRREVPTGRALRGRFFLKDGRPSPLRDKPA